MSPLPDDSFKPTPTTSRGLTLVVETSQAFPGMPVAFAAAARWVGCLPVLWRLPMGTACPQTLRLSGLRDKPRGPLTT